MNLIQSSDTLHSQDHGSLGQASEMLRWILRAFVVEGLMSTVDRAQQRAHSVICIRQAAEQALLVFKRRRS